MSILILTEQFDGKPIEFNRGDAFVNLTAMCAAFDTRPQAFLNLDSTKAFCAELERLNDSQPIISTSRGIGGGTWAHPDLGLECARWLQPAFGIWCNRTIRRILAGDVAITPAVPTTYKEAVKALLVEIEAKEALALENAELRPKGEFFDAVTASDDTLGMNEVAKLLNMGRNRMLGKLRGLRILMTGGDRHNTPYQRYIEDGYFCVTESKWTHPEGTTHLTLTTRVFQRGVDFIRRKLGNQ
jgi:phage antirepressor YoqD-like protein